MVSDKVKEFYKLINEAKYPCAFTGAGVSTLSGIRDFRGRNGVYSQPWHGYNVEEILSLDLFYDKPEIFYAWAKEFIYRLEEYRPSIVHNVLAKLEQLGKLKVLCTQNIDILHQAAGSKNVLEIHGSSMVNHCLRCRKEFSYSEVAPQVLADKLPKCACGGVIKPDIIFYGENLNEKVLSDAFVAMEKCDMIIVAGSSLTVHPAADLPRVAVLEGSVSAKMVLINEQATPLDSIAKLRFNDLEATFTELQQLINEDENA